MRGNSPRMVLALLLAHRAEPLSRERLADELWGERPPASAVSSLHVHLSKIRAAVGDLLLKQPGGYLLDPDRFELDSDRLDDLAERARREPAVARELLAEAIALRRGEPLAGLAVERSLLQWRQELEQRWLRVAVEALDARLASGEAGGLVTEIESLLTQNPYEGRLWGQLMLAHYRNGRQADALDAYQRARQMFVTDLGIDPDERLSALQTQILNQDPALLIPAGARRGAPGLTRTAVPVRDPGLARGQSSPPAAAVISSLPVPPTPLVGREAELSELATICAQPHCRLITLVGPGGVGKTRLALELAQGWHRTCRDGGVLVELAPLTDASQVIGAIVATLARRDRTGELTEQSLGAYLMEREVLLVLDNFEHVLDAAIPVIELLSQAPDLRVLVTSRTPLRLRGEQVYDVEPLAVSAVGAPGGGPAVELFLQGALAVDRQFETGSAARTTVATICRSLDGLPLAIELAAARARLLPLEQIAAELKRPLVVGGYGLRDLPDRHQTLDAAIRWSYDLLSEPARHVLRAASELLGMFEIEALAAVAGDDVYRPLEELLESSLIRHASGGRFRLLELVRAFASERLAEHDAERMAMRERHLGFFLSRYASVAADRFPAEIGRLAQEMAVDHANLRAAVEFALDTGETESAAALIFALQPIWMAGGLAESDRIIRRALAVGTYAPIDELDLLRVANFSNNTRPEGTEWANQRAQRAAELGQLSPLVAASSNLIAHALNRGDLDEALRLRDELLLVTELDGLRPGTRAGRASILGLCAFVEGRHEEAVELLTEALAMAQAAEHPHMLAIAGCSHLFVLSARDGEIRRESLIELIAAAATLQLPDVAVVTLWFVARYAVTFDRGFAEQILAHATRLQNDLDLVLRPEDELRDETLAMLGRADAGGLVAGTPPLSLAQALELADDWLGARPAGERAPRSVLARAPRA